MCQKRLFVLSLLLIVKVSDLNDRYARFFSQSVNNKLTAKMFLFSLVFL